MYSKFKPNEDFNCQSPNKRKGILTPLGMRQCKMEPHEVYYLVAAEHQSFSGRFKFSEKNIEKAERIL